MERPLSVSRSTTFDSTGNASVSMGPATYGEKWTINRMVVSSTCPDTTPTQFRSYRNVVQDSTMMDSTYNGNNDSSDTSISLGTLETIIGVWTQGISGATATMIIYGTYDDGRRTP